jgi:hypothetical protein
MASEMPPMVQIGSAYGGRGPGVLAVSWAGLIFTSILIAGRLHLRLKRTQESQNDFAMWLALVAWVSSLGIESQLTRLMGITESLRR